METQGQPAGQPQQQSQPQSQDTPQEAEKAFSAGYDEDNTGESSASPATVDPTKKPDAPAEGAAAAASPAQTPAASPAAPAAAAAPAGDQPKFAGFTEPEMKQLLARIPSSEDQQRLERQLKQINGWIGNLNAQFNKLAKPAAGAPPSGASTPRELNSEAMTRLREDLPDVAKAIEEVLSGVQGTPGGPSKDEITQLVQSHVGTAIDTYRAAQEKRQQKLVLRDHPDWLQVRVSPEFKTWFAAQPSDYQTDVNEADDATTVSACLAKFKSWKAGQSTSAAEEQRKAEEKRLEQERNQRRLHAAVAPGGVPAQSAPKESAEQAFAKGFAGDG